MENIPKNAHDQKISRPQTTRIKQFQLSSPKVGKDQPQFTDDADSIKQKKHVPPNNLTISSIHSCTSQIQLCTSIWTLYVSLWLNKLNKLNNKCHLALLILFWLTMCLYSKNINHSFVLAYSRNQMERRTQHIPWSAQWSISDGNKFKHQRRRKQQPLR